MMAASKKLSISAENIVNADSVGSIDPQSPNQAYQAQTTLNKSIGDGAGVETVALKRTPSFIPSFEPDSPFANSEGMVNAPNVNLDEELINTKIAEQAYKANVATMGAGLQMHNALIDALNHKS